MASVLHGILRLEGQLHPEAAVTSCDRGGGSQENIR